MIIFKQVKMGKYNYNKIGIIGAGSYGTALAQCFFEKAKCIQLISSSEEVAYEINNNHVNPRSLPGVNLERNVCCSTNFASAATANLLFVVVPTTAIEKTAKNIKQHKIEVPIIMCSKGMDIERGRLLSDSVFEILQNEIVFLSGPSFASEIGQHLPAGVNISGKNQNLLDAISQKLSSDTFKLHAISDFIGLQIAGAFKNVLAIGCGILLGASKGNSAISYLIVQGIKDIEKIIEAFGGKKETLVELCGLGDVILTSTSTKSRNVLFGIHLAKGGNLKNWHSVLVEGAIAAKIIPMLSIKYSIKLNVFNEIYKIIYDHQPLEDTIKNFINSY